MNLEEIAWVAGVFEGEGNFKSNKRRRTETKTEHTIALHVGMTDEDILRKLHKITQIGTVSGPYIYNDNKPIWKWTVNKQIDAYKMTISMLPWLGERRSQEADKLIGFFEHVTDLHKSNNIGRWKNS